MTKNKFCIANNIDHQTFDTLVKQGFIKTETHIHGKVIRVIVDEESFYTLKEGYHYVSCKYCGKKLTSITKKHYKICDPSKKSGETPVQIYSELILINKKKTEEQKKAQSKKLKDRFQTPEGMITRSVIGRASKKLNSDPAYKERTRAVRIEVQNRPEVIRAKKALFKRLWSEDSFRSKRMKQVSENIEQYRSSAANARKTLNKTSKLHLEYKDSMVSNGLEGFITEYEIGYYHIDEADPLARLAIEIDGCYWHGCDKCGFVGDPRIVSCGKRKETFLTNRGWKVLHIKEHDIRENKDYSMKEISEIQKDLTVKAKEAIKSSFLSGSLMAKSYSKDSDTVEWKPITNVLRHSTEHKKLYDVYTENSKTGVTEDHSLFLWGTKDPIKASDLKVGDVIVAEECNVPKPEIVIEVRERTPEKYTYDLSVPGNENFFLSSGVLAHNSYSVSGVSLDIEKSSKYQSMAESFNTQYDKAKEENKLSIKIVKGLQQPRYGVGISSALGPMSRPGVQSRRNFVSGFRGGWS